MKILSFSCKKLYTETIFNIAINVTSLIQLLSMISASIFLRKSIEHLNYWSHFSTQNHHPFTQNRPSDPVDDQKTHLNTTRRLHHPSPQHLNRRSAKFQHSLQQLDGAVCAHIAFPAAPGWSCVSAGGHKHTHLR